jgi:uncharacterized protein YtpQ (UPF0354 family)
LGKELEMIVLGGPGRLHRGILALLGLRWRHRPPVSLPMLLAAAVVACAAPSPPDERVLFRDRVLAVLAVEFPERSFVATDDPEVIELGSSEFGLQNLRARFAGSEGGEEQLVALVREHFEATLAAMETAAGELTWAEAQVQLRPQLAPAEYVEQMPLAHVVLGTGVVAALVLDGEESYRYVLAEDLERWGVAIDRAMAVAEENLDVASAGISFSGSAGPDPFLALEPGDGYAAARILVPRLRRFAAERLGSPFYVAIPNRDFLFLWSRSVSSTFEERVRTEVAKDFESEPYPLTARIFEATGEGLREVRR